MAGLAITILTYGAAQSAAAEHAQSIDEHARFAAHQAVAQPPGWATAEAHAPGVHLDWEQASADASEISVYRDWRRLQAIDAAAPPQSQPRAEPALLTARATGRKLSAADRLRALGFGDGRAYGDEGRVYLFAATSGQAVGLNLTGAGDWTTDATSTLLGDAQVGVGWRQGDVQTSFGYVHREVKSRHMTRGQRAGDDDMVGLSLSVKRGR